MTDYPVIEVRGFKWPRRPTAIASAYLLGEDSYGRWLGVVKGSPWRTADGLHAGVFEASFVKVVPDNTFWTACFNLVDPVVDVDIVLPVCWIGNVLEEVDLELDILRSQDGSVRVRDQEEFDRVREAEAMPDEISRVAEETCERVRILVELGIEPFGDVGREWLNRFLAQNGVGVSNAQSQAAAAARSGKM